MDLNGEAFTTVFMALCSKTDGYVLGLPDVEFRALAARAVEDRMNHELPRFVAVLDAFRLLSGSTQVVTL
jgi:hypothetical protein